MEDDKIFIDQKRKKSSWQVEKSKENKGRYVQKKKPIDTPYGSNTKNVVEEHVSSENKHSGRPPKKEDGGTGWCGERAGVLSSRWLWSSWL